MNNSKRKLARAVNNSPEKKARPEVCDVREWDVNKVADFLTTRNLKFAVENFVSHEINGRALPDLTESLLKEIGIRTVGAQIQILSAIKDVIEPGEGIRTMAASSSYDEEGKVFNDPIHGHISMHPLCIKIMDTPQFQRLRYIKQLGGCYFVFPGASHNRFEHSIGVGHLARELAETLQAKQPELKITRQDVLCVQIAGLCHDLGHGPFSHLFDGRFIPAVLPGSKWHHEEASVRMFEHLVKENNLAPEFKKYGLTDEDHLFIAEQIAGPRKQENGDESWPYKGRTKDKSFLYEIVANKRNGIDVDKWDYFARDCYHLGIRNNFDHNRFMQFARVLDVEGDLQICSRDKEYMNLHAMFMLRYLLHKRAYQHKCITIIEHMITEAMLKANDFIKIPGKDGELKKMSECIDDMEAYTRLTDNIYQQILYSTEDDLKPAREILHKIQCRQLYKFIGQARSQEKDKKFQLSDLDELQKEIVKDSDELTVDMIQLQLVSFDYGMKNENPIDHVRFYMKRDPNQGLRIRHEHSSQLLPNIFYEQYVRLYSKSTEALHVEEASRCFNAWCQERNFVSSFDGDLMSAELTPLKNSNSSQDKTQDSCKTKLFTGKE